MPSRLRVHLRLLVAAVLLWAAPAGAQEPPPEPEEEGRAIPMVPIPVGTPLAPAGHLQIDLRPTIRSWDSRFGLRMEGEERVEEVESLGFDLTRPSGLDLFPGSSELGGVLRELADDPSVEAILGPTRARVTRTRVEVPIEVQVGVTDWLTLGATVPLVQNRTEVAFGLEADSSNLGASPLLTDPVGVRAFVDDLERALGAVRAQLDDPTLEGRLAKALARYRELYRTSPLVPAQGTAAGEALQLALDDLNTDLAREGVEPLTAAVPLATTPVTDEMGLRALLETGGYGYVAPLQTIPAVWELGDVELHGAVRLLTGAVADAESPFPAYSWLVGAGARVRLGTGTPPRTDLVLHGGSGDGQTDVEGRLFAHGTAGRFALRLDARYAVPFSTTLTRRATVPSRVLAPSATLTEVEWTPGRAVGLEVASRLHLTPSLAFTASYRYDDVGEATFEGTLPPVSPDPLVFTGVPGSVAGLGRETAFTVHRVGGGLLFTTLPAWRRGETGFPFEVRFHLRGATSGSGGQAPDDVEAEFALRLYRGLWDG